MYLFVVGSAASQDQGRSPHAAFEGPIGAVGQDRANTVVILPSAEPDEAAEAAIRQYAAEHWEGAALVTDEDALEADLSDKDLVVLGTPEGNRWVNSRLGDLPFRIGPQRIRADVVYRGSYLRLLSVWPSPENPRRGILLCLAQVVGEVRGILAAAQEDADWIIAWERYPIRSGDYEKRGGRWSFAAPASRGPVLSPGLLMRAHLQANHEVVDITDFGPSVDLLDAALPDHDVIFVGEDHGVAAALDVRLALTEYLNRRAGVRYLLLEDGPSQAALFNRFLDTGDTALLDDYLADLRGAPAWSENTRQFWVDLRALNERLPEARKLRCFGVDTEMWPRLAVRYLCSLLPTCDPPESIAALIGHLRAARDALETERDQEHPWAGSLFAAVARSVASQPETYESYLGDAFFEFELTARSLGGRPGEGGRDRLMYDNFLRIHHANPPGKYLAQFGAFHAYRAPLWERRTFAGYLDSEPDSPVRGRVLTIDLAFRDSETMLYDAKSGVYRHRATGTAWNSRGLVDFHKGNEPVLFRVSGPDSPFNTYSIGFPFEVMPNAAGSAAYSQFLLLVTGSPAKAPLGGW